MIDLSDPQTFGKAVDEHLSSGCELTFAYHNSEAARDEAYKGGRSPLREPNPHTEAWTVFREDLASLVRNRDILAYHYSRMTDREVQRVFEGGFQPTSLALLRLRLDGQIEEGNLTEQMARAIFQASPLHSMEYGIRLGMFWLTCPAVPIHSGRVSSLVGEWGGEAANWCLEGEEKTAVQSIGLGRVFSVSVPLSASNHDSAWAIACHIAGRYARGLGLRAEIHGHDLCVTEPVVANRILNVLSEGEDGFEAHGM